MFRSRFGTVSRIAFVRIALVTAIVAILVFSRVGDRHLSSAAVEVDTDALLEMTLRERLEGFRVGAHRGGSTQDDSNTIHRFEQARLAGADIVEMDLRTTKDGVPIVYHDPRLPDGWFEDGAEIRDLTYDELAAHTLSHGHAIPTFEEVLDWARGRIVVNAEFKDRACIEPAIELVRKYGAHEWVYFQTKADHLRYALARELDDRVALLFKPDNERRLDWALELEDDRLMIIELDVDMATPEIIDRVHAAGKLTSKNAWHFDMWDEMAGSNCAAVFERGIDIAITKRPKSGVHQRDRLMRETGDLAAR